MSIFNLTKPLDDFIPDHGHAKAVAAGSTRSQRRFNNSELRAAEVWRPEYLITIQQMAAMGHAASDIALCMGVRKIVFDKWVKEKFVVQHALTSGILAANANVKHSLYLRAVGYEHPETKFFYDKEVGVVSVETTKHYPPDTTAASFWLRNREPENWKDVQRQEITGADGGPIELRQVRERNTTIIEQVAGRVIGGPAEG